LNKIEISVIVPTCNRAHILPVCLDSLINQSYPRELYEIIIVDNNSTDNTREVAREFINDNEDVQIKYVFEGKRGLVYSRHSGVRNSEYQILSFTDDDCIASVDWLKEVAGGCGNHKDIGAVAGKIRIKWDGVPPEWINEYEYLLGKIDLGENKIIDKYLNLHGGNYNIRKDVLYELGGFNPDQIGDWLIGDGETGLTYKLWESGYLICWSPEAVVEHCQTVEKNATVDDVKRRYINNGIAVPYKLFTDRNKISVELILSMVKAVIKIMLKQAAVITAFFSSNGKKQKKKFELAYLYAQIKYTLRIMFDSEWRDYLVEKDWVLKYDQ